jgi:hypothetical protein
MTGIEPQRHPRQAWVIMMRRRLSMLFCLVMLAALAIVASSHGALAGVVLITPEEARLPTPKDVFASRAITRGPHIDLAGRDEGQLRSPLPLQVKFRGFGGATINLDSLRVTYLTSPNVDLTPRVKPYVGPSGIEIQDAEVPPGEHLLRVELQDSEGRRTTTTFLLSVSP